MNRRSFFKTGAFAALAFPNLSDAQEKIWRIGIIGHTGRGNYGHDLDIAWLQFPNCKIVGVSDPNEAGLARAQERLQVGAGFLDYRRMLAETRPDIVAVCPRHIDGHLDMCLAALNEGVRGLYVEKPFCRSPREADRILTACEVSGVKLAIAHRNRYHPVLSTITRLLEQGALGEILEIRCRGKEDHRGGVEDLWVLGSHVLNLAHYFGGDPLSCQAQLFNGIQPAGKTDVKSGNEGIGPVAGNRLHARYEMSKGFPVFFDSIRGHGDRRAGFGMQIMGNKGVVNIRCDEHPLAFFTPGNPFLPTAEANAAQPITTNGPGRAETRSDIPGSVQSHSLAIQDLIQAIQNDEEPLCGKKEGLTNIEMICAAMASHVNEGRSVTFPLSQRENALL